MWRKIIKEETNAGKFMRCEKFFPLQFGCQKKQHTYGTHCPVFEWSFSFFSVFWEAGKYIFFFWPALPFIPAFSSSPWQNEAQRSV